MIRPSNRFVLSIISCVLALVADALGDAAPSQNYYNAPAGIAQQPNPQPAGASSPARLVNSSLPLRKPRADQTSLAGRNRLTSTKSATTVFGSLAIVLGLFFLFVWFTKRHAPQGSAVLPRDAVEVLGRVASGAKQQMELVRLGNKLVLLSVSSHGTTPLAEVIDPNEVERLTSLCRRGRDRSAARQLSSRANA